jgi:integrase
MPREIHRLTAIEVKHAEPGWHADGGNLYLQVSRGKGEAVRKSWVFRFGWGGKERWMGLGSLDLVGLKEARWKALECRQALLDGIDPLEQRKASKAAARLANARSMTFDQCRDAYIEAHRASWRNVKHAAQWTATLKTYVTPVFGKLPVQQVDRNLVLRALEPIWSKKPETARRVRGRIERILDFAEAREYRPQGTNPARLLPIKTALGAQAKGVKHHAALPYDEIGSFMRVLRKRDGVAARALEFAILTAARTSEVIGATWDEFNLAERIWIVPVSRMKGGREHRVPLSDAALSVLQSMSAAKQNAYVFPGDRRETLSNMALEMTLRRMKRADVTVHGFRSSFRDWAAERTNFPREVAEAALAHVVGDKVEAAYRRGDLFLKRRQLMDAWARFCWRVASTGTVVPLRRSQPDRPAVS